MKEFKTYISETLSHNKCVNEWKLTNDSKYKVDKYKYHPKTTEALRELVAQRIKENEKAPYLLDIDTSAITDMNALFASGASGYLRSEYGIDSDGIEVLDLSEWDISNVTDMSYMFKNCYKLKDIIGVWDWNVSKVTDMEDMFFNCWQCAPNWYDPDKWEDEYS